MQTFEMYWKSFYKSSTMPAVFDAAMRDLALSAWNAALESAASIANEGFDTNKTMTKIEDLITS